MFYPYSCASKSWRVLIYRSHVSRWKLRSWSPYIYPNKLPILAWVLRFLTLLYKFPFTASVQPARKARRLFRSGSFRKSVCWFWDYLLLVEVWLSGCGDCMGWIATVRLLLKPNVRGILARCQSSGIAKVSETMGSIIFKMGINKRHL